MIGHVQVKLFCFSDQKKHRYFKLASPGSENTAQIRRWIHGERSPGEAFATGPNYN